MAVEASKTACGIQGVGETAGEVWQYLRKVGKADLNAVEREVKAPKQITQMAIGWLAREGKLDLCQEGKVVQLWLKE